MARMGAMSRHELDVATWVAVARLGLMSRHHFDVATWAAVWAEKRCRDPAWRSRPGRMSRPDLGAGCLGVSRQVHAQQARDLRWLRERHAHDKLAVRAAAPTT